MGNFTSPLVFVVLEGFEPSQAEPESDVLPLHHRTFSKPLQRYYYFLILQSFRQFFSRKQQYFFRMAVFRSILGLKIIHRSLKMPVLARADTPPTALSPAF